MQPKRSQYSQAGAPTRLTHAFISRLTKLRLPGWWCQRSPPSCRSQQMSALGLVWYDMGVWAMIVRNKVFAFAAASCFSYRICRCIGDVMSHGGVYIVPVVVDLVVVAIEDCWWPRTVITHLSGPNSYRRAMQDLHSTHCGKHIS